MAVAMSAPTTGGTIVDIEMCDTLYVSYFISQPSTQHALQTLISP